MRFVLCAVLCLALAPCARAATFTVTSTADIFGSSCGATCSLRQAINAANLQAGADVISFAIPGSGPFTISPTTLLPTLSDSVTVDGYSQLGAAPNTLTDGDDAVILIQVDGSGAGNNALGFAVCGSNSLVRGLSITGFSRGGVFVGAQADFTTACPIAPEGVTIAGNFIGLLPDGATAAGQGLSGVMVRGSPGTVIGGVAPADRNVISANRQYGIVIGHPGVDGSKIDGNYLGTDAGGTLDRGNWLDGVAIALSASDVSIGSSSPNRIAFNRNGILVVSASTAVALQGNDIGPNKNLGIDLSASDTPDGVTANDINDIDTGGNNLQNFPVLSDATAAANSLTVNGTLDIPTGISNALYQIALYENESCDTPGGHGEGEIFLGSNFVSLSSNAENFSVTLPITPPQATASITATATDANGNTSEFSACLSAPPINIIFDDSYE